MCIQLGALSDLEWLLEWRFVKWQNLSNFAVLAVKELCAVSIIRNICEISFSQKPGSNELFVWLWQEKEFPWMSC